jgi:hypothetical protein
VLEAACSAQVEQTLVRLNRATSRSRIEKRLFHVGGVTRKEDASWVRTREAESDGPHPRPTIRRKPRPACGAHTARPRSAIKRVMTAMNGLGFRG